MGTHPPAPALHLPPHCTAFLPVRWVSPRTSAASASPSGQTSQIPAGGSSPTVPGPSPWWARRAVREGLAHTPGPDRTTQGHPERLSGRHYCHFVNIQGRNILGEWKERVLKTLPAASTSKIPSSPRENDVTAKDPGFGVRKPGFKSQLCHSLTCDLRQVTSSRILLPSPKLVLEPCKHLESQP